MRQWLFVWIWQWLFEGVLLRRCCGGDAAMVVYGDAAVCDDAAVYGDAQWLF